MKVRDQINDYQYKEIELPEGWSVAEELEWRAASDEVDRIDYENDYLAAGGTSSFRDWQRGRRADESLRHRGPEDIRPFGEARGFFPVELLEGALPLEKFTPEGDS